MFGLAIKKEKEEGKEGAMESSICLNRVQQGGLLHCLLTEWNVNMIWLAQKADKSVIPPETLQIIGTSLPATPSQRVKTPAKQ